MKRWFAIHTKPGGERLAEGNLLRQGFEAYLPLRTKTRRRGRRGVSIKTPLFPRYIFVRIDLDEQPWRKISNTFGVAYIVSFGGRPAPLQDSVIDEIKARETDDGVIDLSQLQTLTPGDAVKIADGAFTDRTGIFQCASDKDRVIVLLNLLGRQTSVKVSRTNVIAAA
ncbi:MAG: transcription termination/antitermination NusG family protein [Alphaproteobacteria bacterium]